jgi:glycosyltransferase involved in cell wall biosynthesis
MISYCITLKNRADLLDKHLENLLGQTFPACDIQLCISDGYSSDNPESVLKKYAGKFGQILFCHSDRDMLPFKISCNNPTCDENALVANIATQDICVLTDPEVCWINRKSLRTLVDKMEDKPDTYRPVPCYMGVEGYENWGYAPVEIERTKGLYDSCRFALLFHRSAFMRLRGFEERFALGYACEDCYLTGSWDKAGMKQIDTQDCVFHHWHDDKHLLPENIQLHELNMNLSEKLNYTLANEYNSAWTRPEMIKDFKII